MKRLAQMFGTIAFWVSWPALRVYLRGSERTRVIIRSGQDILLVKSWLSAGQWGLPGGGLHENELPTSGASREVFEETGLLLQPEKLQYLKTEPLRQHGLQCTCHYFCIDVAARPGLQRQLHEISDLAWVPIEAVNRKAMQPEVLRGLELLASQ